MYLHINPCHNYEHVTVNNEYLILSVTININIVMLFIIENKNEKLWFYTRF